MTSRRMLVLPLAIAILLAVLVAQPAVSCCAVFPSGKPVVNADQTVLIVWDAANKTQHFIRQASFKSDADNFGFLVPSPTQPELDESGNEAFSHLRKLTEPEMKRLPAPRAVGCGCGARHATLSEPLATVRVLEEKRVAGFNAVVLEATSATALVNWLKENGFHYSPEVEAWAKPYVDAGWKITALKVSSKKDEPEQKSVAAAALRMSFKTDRPLFPYREPDSTKTAAALEAKRRLLRIYFVAATRHEGALTKESPWTGRVAWAGKLKPEERTKTLELLKLPATTGPADWYLTEFEDNWPYQVAPADVYFAQSKAQEDVRREPIIEYVAAPLPTDVTVYALAAALMLTPLLARVRRSRPLAA